jgi:hypothetical protein
MERVIRQPGSSGVKNTAGGRQSSFSEHTGAHMKQALVILLLIPVIAMAQPTRYASRTSADEAFEARPKATPSVIRWVVSADPNTECREASGQKLQGSRGEIRACAVYSAKSCTIITGVETSHAILGHELRHCFEGRFHD